MARGHVPTRLDVITDMRRCIYASYTKDGFEDTNVKTFLKNAENILKTIDLDKNTRSLITERLKKAKNPKQPIEKRREDLLMVASII